MPAPSETRPGWAAHKSKIKNLYWNHEKELPEVMQIMKDHHGFVATKKMYKKHFKLWGLQKNLKADEAIAMLHIGKRRRLEKNKDTDFYRRGKLVKHYNLRRFAKRRGFTVPGDAQVATPPYITYRTPEPDPSNNSPPPTSLPCPASEASEWEQATAGDSPESYDLGRGGSPLCSDIPLVPPMSMSWFSDGADPGSQGSAHTIMPANFIPDAFSRPQESERPTYVSPGHLTPSPFPVPWVDATDPPHDYAPSVDGPPPSWAIVQPPPQHSLRWAGDIPAFTSNPSQDMRHVTHGIDAFGHLNQSHLGYLLPDTVSHALDHTDLHNAVVCGDFDGVKTLLGAGANPNCSARGGMTPLHYAACQRNVEMARLLLDHGANLDAMTDQGRSVLFFSLRSQGHSGSSDTLAYANHRVFHTDEDTLLAIKALFNSPTRWTRLLHALEKADKDGTTPLMVAAGEGFFKTARMLLKRGAGPEVRDHANHTALKYAARNNHRDLVRLLLLADPAVSTKRDLSHILKLASKNFTARTATGHAHGEDAQGRWWDDCHRASSALIADEMVRRCREMGVLDGFLGLAEQRRKADVLELLMDAVRRLDMAVGGS